MPRLVPVDARAMERVLQRLGFARVRRKGSHVCRRPHDQGPTPQGRGNINRRVTFDGNNALGRSMGPWESVPANRLQRGGRAGGGQRLAEGRQGETVGTTGRERLLDRPEACAEMRESSTRVNFLNLGRRSEFLLAGLAVAEVAEDQIDPDAAPLMQISPPMTSGLVAIRSCLRAILIISSLPSSARTLVQSPVRGSRPTPPRERWTDLRPRPDRLALA